MLRSRLLQELSEDRRRTMKARVMQESEFDGLVLDSVTERLTDMLGAKFTDNFIRLLEVKFHIPKRALPKSLDNFTSILSSIFGSASALVMGRAIAKRLYARLEMPFVEKAGYTLLNYATEAKIKMKDQGRIE